MGVLSERPGEIDMMSLEERVDFILKDAMDKGILSLEEIEKVREMKLEIPEKSCQPSEDINCLLSIMHANWDVSENIKIESHRKGVRGFLIVLFKKVLYRITKPYLSTISKKQIAFNLACLKIISSYLAKQEERITALEEDYEDLLRSSRK